VKVLVTGADGFVGRWLVRRLGELGHEVVAAHGPPNNGAAALVVDVTDPASIGECIRSPVDAVIHLAAVASGSESLSDPLAAWRVNAAGTALVAGAVGELVSRGAADPVFLYASTAEVYGAGDAAPRREADPVAPCSPYAASKAAGELGALEVGRRTGLRVVVARAFAHTGPGQDTRFVAPAFVERLRLAKQRRAPAVKVGRLDPVRELLDVRDVVDAYVALLDGGAAGEVYNVCGGETLSIGELFERLAVLLDASVLPEVDPGLTRPADIPHLVGDPHKIRSATGWHPQRTLAQTLADLVHAEAD
jgi:GDP-4-dehydro-6-deoxy-D-mannose reductase